MVGGCSVVAGTAFLKVALKWELRRTAKVPNHLAAIKKWQTAS